MYVRMCKRWRGFHFFSSFRFSFLCVRGGKIIFFRFPVYFLAYVGNWPFIITIMLFFLFMLCSPSQTFLCVKDDR